MLFLLSVTFDEKSKQSEDHLFLAAVEEACLRPTEVQGFLEVDVAGYGARRNQYLKNPMRPIPRSLRHKLRTVNIMLMFHIARKTRSRGCRRFGNHGEAFSFCIYTRCHKPLFGFLLAFSCAHLQSEELEGSPQCCRSNDPPKIDDGAKQAKLKGPEVGIQINNLRKNVSQKRSLQDTCMPQLRIFDSDDLSRSNKKRSSPGVQEQTITEKQKKGKTIDSMVARKKIESLIQKRNLFGLSQPSYRIQPQKGSAAELPKWSKPNMQLPEEDRHQMERRTQVTTLQYAKDLMNINLFPTMDVYAIDSVSGGCKNSSQTTRTPAEKVFAERVAAYPMGGRSWPYPAKPLGVYPPHYPAAVEEVGRLYPPPPARYTQVGDFILLYRGMLTHQRRRRRLVMGVRRRLVMGIHTAAAAAAAWVRVSTTAASA
ncbi:UNVERIFIED_CONTAM: hypothetical protein Sangu_1966000 [Sesamum angustifolium]|uniref:Uncharacterized protein n=1 Tax=Sesamum angustifolium TaxID=2727405 RepID=A0AAW2LXE8_9LAMI